MIVILSIGEDWKISQLLFLAGCIPQDTRDEHGKETFLVMDVSNLIQGHFPEWYKQRDVNGALKVEFFFINAIKY